MSLSSLWRYARVALLFRLLLAVALQLVNSQAGAQCDERDVEALASRIAADQATLEEISDLLDLGLGLKEKNRSAEALEPLRRAERIASERLPADHVIHVTTRQNLATVLDDLGRLGEALRLYREALTLAEALPSSRVFRCWDRLAAPGRIRADQVVMATVHNNLGDVLGRLNRSDESIAHWQEAVRIRRQIMPDDSLLANALLGLAVVYNKTGRYDEARPLLDQALAVVKRTGGNDTMLARIRNSQCHLLNNTGQARLALPLCEEAVQLEEQAAGIGSANLPSFLSNLSASYRQLNRPEQSGRQLVRAVALAESSKRPHLSWLANSNLLAHLQSQGRTSAAIVFGKRSIDLIQGMRASLGGFQGSFSVDFMQDKYKTYRLVADLLFAEGRTDEALQVLEWLRDEESLDFTERSAAGKSRPLPRNPAEQALLNGFANAAAALAVDEARRVRLRQSVEAGRALSDLERRELDTLQGSLDANRDRIYRQITQWSAPARVQRDGMRVAVPLRLPKDKAFLGYVVSDNRIWVYWNEGGETRAQQLPVSKEWLHTRLMALRLTVEKVHPRQQPEEVLGELYRALFQPVEGRIRAHHIVLATVDELRYLPFAALFDGQDYLVRRYTFEVYTPAGGAEIPGVGRQGKGLLGFGVTRASAGWPALPGVATEICGIVRGPIHGSGKEEPCAAQVPVERRGVIEGEGYLNEGFTEERLLAAASQRTPPRFLHIATHFELGALASQSFLVLDRDARLGLDRLRKADFGGVAALTLSACNTARVPDGSQFQGFAAYARSRGARRVIASQWNANDASTPLLMSAFYRAAAAQAEADPAQALRTAQIAVLDHRVAGQRPYAHPYHWGGFVVFGEADRN